MLNNQINLPLININLIDHVAVPPVIGVDFFYTIFWYHYVVQFYRDSLLNEAGIIGWVIG